MFQIFVRHHTNQEWAAYHRPFFTLAAATEYAALLQAQDESHGLHGVYKYKVEEL